MSFFVLDQECCPGARKPALTGNPSKLMHYHEKLVFWQISIYQTSFTEKSSSTFIAGGDSMKQSAYCVC